MNRIATIVLALLGALVAGQATAQTAAAYPDRPIKAIVPFPPGGGTDIFGRIIGQNLGGVIGQPVVIENRSGVEGNIGMEAVARSAPDGYTILFNSSAATVNPAMYTKLRFDPVADLVPVAIVCEYHNVIVVNDKVQAKTLGEFVDLMRKNPGKVNAAAGGTRLGLDIFRVQNDLDFAFIPFRGGGDAITSLVRGDTDFMIVNTPGIIAFLRAGKLRALASTGPQRQWDLPDVPTTREAGMPQYDYGSFFAVYTRAGTPAEIIAKLNAAINTITQRPEVVKALRDGGAAPVQKTPEDALKQYRGDIAKYREIVQRAKIPTLD